MNIRTLRCEWVPTPSLSTKLVVVLHGRGDSSAGFRWLPDALGLDVNYLLVNAPDPYYGGHSWYDLPPHQRPGVERSRALLDGLFAEIARSGFAPENTALLGFSQGCLMTLEWGGRSAVPLAAYVGVSGYCLDPDALLGGLSAQARRPVWLITHGTEDEVLPFAQVESQMARLREGGLPLRFVAYAKGHSFAPEELEEVRRFLAEPLGLGGIDRPTPGA